MFQQLLYYSHPHPKKSQVTTFGNTNNDGLGDDQQRLHSNLAGGERYGFRWQVRSQGRPLHGREQRRRLGQEVEGPETTEAARAAAQA